ncbi:cytochrome P450 6k1-like [Polistes fuscatus]|uniref:cytochrome P450 6k1-like n=1 Tax=Polistes fuscatus TaxID=30207 RepID=UPI001CA962F0|nr:cytochrome P450 6k1-like [Polistes fuscatus]
MAISWILSELIYVLIFIIIGTYLYYKIYVFNFWSKRGVPYVKPMFPVGNFLDVILERKIFGEIFAEIYFKYKKFPYIGTFSMYKPNLVINDPDLIRFVLAQAFTNFQDHGYYCNEKNDPFSGNLLFLHGKKWRNTRLRLAPTFNSNGKIKCMFAIVRDKGYALEEFLADKAKNKNEIEIKDIARCFLIDVIMSTAFGVESNCLKDPKSEFNQCGRKMFSSNILKNVMMLFVPEILKIFSIPYVGKSEIFMKVFKTTVEYRKVNNIVRDDFLNVIIQMMENGYVDYDEGKKSDVQTKVKKLTMLEGAAQSFGYYLAGFESPSTTLTFCLYELALNQDIQQKVHEEIDMILEKHDGITIEAINEMSYLQMVILETLRKYPTMPILNRICNKEIELPNYNIVVPVGTIMIIPVLGIQRDPEYYPEPDKFIPERFTDEEIRSRNQYIYLPFGEGPRICPGTRFGIVEMKIALILSTIFKFRSVTLFLQMSSLYKNSIEQ